MKKHIDKIWIFKILIITFVVSFLFAIVSETVIPNVNIIIGIIILIIFICIGVLFDMIGVAVTASDPVPFNSMASRKIKVAKVAIILQKNADKVASFCNDVIGDICGVVSGTVGVIISSSLVNSFGFNLFYTSLLVTSLIASLTIGLKAICKSFAINNANGIIYNFSKVIYVFYKAN